MPLPSPSKMSKACLMSFTYSRGIVKVTYSSALKAFFSGTLGSFLAAIFLAEGVWFLVVLFIQRLAVNSGL